MDLSSLLDSSEVFGPQNGAFSEVRTEVVNQHPSRHVLDPSIPPLQSVSLHYWQHRFGMGTTGRGIRLYNTFTHSKEELRPLDGGRVRIYSCGPTVYRYVHIGNLRTFMLPDLLCRSLEYLGYGTTQVMNITDVGHLTDDTFDRGEDKMLVSARLEKKSPEEIAAYYSAAFMDDAAKANIRRAAQYPRASDYIPQLIELIRDPLEHVLPAILERHARRRPCQVRDRP